MSKILVWLSGGVDSAVSAFLLKEAGHEVSCGFMINYLSDTDDCPTRVDMEEARRVAEYLWLPFHTFDFRDEYDRRIVEYIYDGYQKGITPNPDVLCNNLVKFDVFLKEALEYGFDKIATGHYARIISTPLTRGDERSEGGLWTISDKGGAQGPINLPPWQGGCPRGGGLAEDYIPYNPKLTRLAQQNRKNPTLFEKKFWYDILKTPYFDRYKFTKQKPLLNYIVDFYCSELQLAIEIDGDSHSENTEYDNKRSEELGQHGVRVLRYTNQVVMQNLQDIYTNLIAFIENNPPVFDHPPYQGGKGQTTFHLLKWIDPNKDQSYFLSRLSQYQLSHALFPIGHLEKAEVREIARKAGLPNAERKDSQWLCFIGKVSMKEFLEKRLPKKAWDILDSAGKVISQHEGAFSYTIWQRKGIQIGWGPALFVIAKNIAENTITVWNVEELKLYSNRLTALEWHWVATPREFPFRAKAKIRYRQEDQDIECVALDESRVEIRFSAPQRAITSGQIVVVYDGDEVVGSGMIE